MTIYKCSVCEYYYTQSFLRSHDRKLEYRGPCRLCEIEERLAELQNLAQKHVENGSWSSYDVKRDSTLASTVAMLESRLSALDERMDAVQPCRCRCWWCLANVSSLACADVNTSSNDDAPDAAVATAVAALVANIRGMAETEALAVKSSPCEALAMANPPEIGP